MVVRKIRKIGFAEHRIKFSGQVFGVFRSNSKRNERADISQDGRSHLLIQLIHVLVSQHQA